MPDSVDLLAASIPFTVERPDGLPDGFRVRADGVYRRVDTGDGSEWRWLCSPIRVLALPRRADGRGWGRLLEITDPDGTAHRWAIPAELLAGDGTDLRREAFSLGLRLSTEKGARGSFNDLLQQWIPAARAQTTDHLGWADETCRAFILGDGRVLGDEGVVFQSEHAPGAAAGMKAAGSLDDWREGVASRAVGNPLMIASIALAFGGPLLDPLAIEGGGIHLRGASSRGKSTLQRASVSVWGSPAFLQRWRATANGLEGVAATCNSTLVALDEMGEVSAREAGAAVYMLANGAGKARASRTGAARPSTRWRTMILSSGEITLADKLAEAGQRAKAGQDVRLLDIQADGRMHGAFDDLHGEPSGAAFADLVNRAAASSYGTAGPTFAQALVDDLDGHLVALRKVIDAFEASARNCFDLEDGQTLRAAKRIALIAAAGEMATAFGLTGWPSGAARDAALDVLGLWIEGRGGGGAAEAREAVERVRSFIVAHGASRFEDVSQGAGDAGRIVNRAGWRDGDTYYLASDVWKAEVHAGADAKRAARHLRDAGYLAPGDGRNFTVRTPRHVHGRPRAYAVSARIMGGDGDL